MIRDFPWHKICFNLKINRAFENLLMKFEYFLSDAGSILNLFYSKTTVMGLFAFSKLRKRIFSWILVRKNVLTAP